MDPTLVIIQRIKDLYGSINRFSKEVGIPQSTLATALKKEDGLRKMSVNSMIDICNKLGLDINALFSEPVESLSVDESRLINIYREVDKAGKDFIMNSANMMKEYEDEKIITLIPMVNEGKIPTIQLDYYDQAAGMGSGQIVENPIPEKINIASNQVPANTDFVIRVYGDSMEPTYHSNDKLFIQSTNTLEIGDIGVFSFNGEQLVKEFGKGVLISHNKEYSPIKIIGDLFIQGKVLGKV